MAHRERMHGWLLRLAALFLTGAAATAAELPDAAAQAYRVLEFAALSGDAPRAARLAALLPGAAREPQLFAQLDSCLAAGTAAAMCEQVAARLRAFGVAAPPAAPSVQAAEARLLGWLVAGLDPARPETLPAPLVRLVPLFPGRADLADLARSAAAVVEARRRHEAAAAQARAALTAAQRALETFRQEKIPANFYEERQFQKMTATERDAIVAEEKRLAALVEQFQARVRELDQGEPLGPGQPRLTAEQQAALLRQKLAPLLLPEEAVP